MMEEAPDWLARAETIQTLLGIEVWFGAQPGRKAPMRRKQLVVTLTAIFPLMFLVPMVVTPWLSSMPMFLERLVASACVVALMVWAVMPRFTRLVSGWLHGQCVQPMAALR